MTHILSVSVSEELFNAIKQYKISPTEAFRTGITVILADNDIPEYQNRLQSYRKLHKVSQLLEEMREKVERLEKNVVVQKGYCRDFTT